LKKLFTGCKLESCRLAFQLATFQLSIFLLIFLAGCQPRQTVTLALLGDLMLGRGVVPKTDSLAFLTPEMAGADLALANLESPLSPSLPAADSTYNLCASSERANLLSAWGLDLLSIANNHSSNCGPDGSNDTVKALTAAGITPIGSGMLPVYRNVNGLRLAFLAFDDITSPLDAEAAVQAIRSAHESGALVIVSIHWGMEYQGGASERQKSLAEEFAGAGAALVWGHHPHVLQPAGWIRPPAGSDPTKVSTLVLYSLGNALFDQGGLEDTRRSALMVVTLDGDGVSSARSVPFEIDVANSRVVQPDAATAEKIREKINLP
jgi:poly-gamma-glutamate synthesis protein (capsule biosynthesis protein)